MNDTEKHKWKTIRGLESAHTRAVRKVIKLRDIKDDPVQSRVYIAQELLLREEKLKWIQSTLESMR